MRREKGKYKSIGSWAIIVLPCTSRKVLRTDSQKGIGEILNTKLATIDEEPENFYDYESHNNKNNKLWFKGTKGKDLLRSRFKRSRLQLVSHNLCIKGSYINFLAGFVAKGSLTGLPRY